MTDRKLQSMIDTVEKLRRLSFSVHGTMDAVDYQNIIDIIRLLDGLKEGKNGSV